MMPTVDQFVAVGLLCVVVLLGSVLYMMFTDKGPQG